MSEEIFFKCSECGSAFPADPDAMVELEFGAELVETGEADALLEQGRAIAAEDLAELGAEELREIELTPDERDAMLRGETIKKGVCICVPCQDRMASEQEGGAEV